MCVGIPARVIRVSAAKKHSALVDIDGTQREVNTMMVDGEGLTVGDWVLLHVGFAMGKIDEVQAQETLAFMREIGSA